jgi:hypothetical protein
MTARKPRPIVFISGVTEPAHWDELAALVKTVESVDLRLAGPSAPASSSASHYLDLTALSDEDAIVQTLRHLPLDPRTRLLIREQQVGFTSVAQELQRRGAPCAVLYSHVSFDSDPALVEQALADLASAVNVELFALDLFCDVHDSWKTLSVGTQRGEFTLQDLERVCALFPAVLTADIAPTNVADIATFRGARGVLLACNVHPRLPQERHVLQYRDIRAAIAQLRARSL